MQANQLKQKLAAGETAFGAFFRYPDPDHAEFLSLQGFDFLVFDAEHGTIEPGDCQQMVRSAELHGVTPIVRPPMNHPRVILRYMDTGAQGVLVPMVNSADEAADVVAATKYLPTGQRGLAGSRAADYGQKLSLEDYTRFANKQTLVVVQIETVEAVAALPEIVQVEAVDVVFVGPTDLSASLGVTGHSDHPKMREALDRITQVVTDSDKVLGIMVANGEAAQLWASRGAGFISIPYESLAKQACQNYLKTARAK